MGLSGEKLRVAIVGLGKMGLLHSGILNVLEGVEVAAFCDKSALMRRFLKRGFKQAVVTGDVEKLSGLNVDAVFVTTPIPSHFPVVKKVFDYKITSNLFVEKPLAASYGEAEKMCELARGCGGVNMVGYMRRFATTFRKAKELLAEEVLGDLISFRAYAYSSDFVSSATGARASAFRGGVLSDLGCHVIDLALWFFDEFRVDSAKVGSISGDGSDEHVLFRVNNSNGFGGEFDVSWSMKDYRLPEAGFLIVGSNGIMEVNDDKVKLKKLKNGKPNSWFRHDLGDNVSFWLGGPEYFREDELFVNAVREHKGGEPSFYLASKVDQVIDEVKRRADLDGR